MTKTFHSLLRSAAPWLAVLAVVSGLGAVALPGLGVDGFEDVPPDHTFASDIAWLAASGITRGCNPPDNTRFCPNDNVTRGQMAAFLVRALGLTADGPTFDDTTGHVFETDISRLAQAGITRGCNPPNNTRFCPNDNVTRGQMAAFLRRALEGGSGPGSTTSTSTTTTTTTTTTTMVPAGLHITTSSLPDAHIFEQYSVTLEAAGGTPPYTWTIDTGSTDLVGNPTGTITNASLDDTLATGDLMVEATVTDADGSTDSVSLPLVVLDVVDITTGSEHSCAADESGAAFCWGNNDLGQLGDGTTDISNRPVRVDLNGIDGKITAISAGSYHTCAIISDPAPYGYCWGANTFGQLGDGTYDMRLTPTPVHTSFGTFGVVRAIEAGNRHTCVIDSVGRVFCWGVNASGQLGDGSTDPSPTGVRAIDTTMGKVEEISPGHDHTCAVNEDDVAYCWGAFELVGGLAVPGDDQLEPVAVFSAGIGKVLTLSAGSVHTCAIDTGGDPWCWGDNGRGQLGEGGDISSSFVPVATDPAGTAAAGQISSGLFHSCSIGSGIIWCWGEPGSGRLGNGMTSDGTSPAAAVSGAALVAAGGAHTCMAGTAGGVWCTGLNSSGQLGTGSYLQRTIFTPVVPG